MGRYLVGLLCLTRSCQASWVDDVALQRRAAEKSGKAAQRFVVNLELPPAERWTGLSQVPAFVNYKQDLTQYLAKYVPKSALPLIAEITKMLKGSFHPEYAEEMIGLSKTLGVDVGDIVLANLIYQLEHLGGVTCEKRNVTGPCPPKLQDGPGLCTGVVVDGGAAGIWQGRNLDWNLDAILLKYVLHVEYRRANRTVFSGVQIVGQIGVLHGMKPGSFSVQLNARDTGGNVATNLVSLLRGFMTPMHAMRHALESQDNFSAALNRLSGQRLTNPCYFIVAGVAHGEGAIVTRDRSSAADVWHLYQSPTKDAAHVNEQPDWFRLQTNYDHWQAVPSYDDRRTAGVAHVKELCTGSVGRECVSKVMNMWPTKNHHTDVTSVMSPKAGYFDVAVWTEPAASAVYV